MVRVLAMAVGVPILLLLMALLMWICCWTLHHIAAKLHRQYGHARWDRLRRLQASFSFKPDSLLSYLQPRMLITVIVLAYSCYPLITSSLLHTLACDSISAPRQILDPTGYEYSRLHYQWLEYRATAILQSSFNSSGLNSNMTGVVLLPGEGKAERNTSVGTAAATGASAAARELCSPGYQHVLDDGLCWVAGLYWQQDYSIKCFVGPHYGLAIFGIVSV